MDDFVSLATSLEGHEIQELQSIPVGQSFTSNNVSSEGFLGRFQFGDI